MRHGLWRTLSALLSGTAFAVSVAGPVQWDPCPMHGVAAVLAAHVATPVVAMEMAPGEEMSAVPPAHVHTGHGAHDAHHAGHLCTCPGGCCSSTPVGLNAALLSAALTLHINVPTRLAPPTDAVELASSPQVALPFAQAPPSIRVTPHHAAHTLT